MTVTQHKVLRSRVHAEALLAVVSIEGLQWSTAEQKEGEVGSRWQWGRVMQHITWCSWCQGGSLGGLQVSGRVNADTVWCLH